jgi:hypothetical protein
LSFCKITVLQNKSFAKYKISFVLVGAGRRRITRVIIPGPLCSLLVCTLVSLCIHILNTHTHTHTHTRTHTHTSNEILTPCAHCWCARWSVYYYIMYSLCVYYYMLYTVCILLCKVLCVCHHVLCWCAVLVCTLVSVLLHNVLCVCQYHESCLLHVMSHVSYMS